MPVGHDRRANPPIQSIPASNRCFGISDSIDCGSGEGTPASKFYAICPSRRKSKVNEGVARELNGIASRHLDIVQPQMRAQLFRFFFHPAKECLSVPSIAYVTDREAWAQETSTQFRNPAISATSKSGGQRERVDNKHERVRNVRTISSTFKELFFFGPGCVCVNVYRMKLFSYNFLDSPRWMWKPVSLSLSFYTFFLPSASHSSPALCLCACALRKLGER